jgi:DNA-binding NtrC family response regulator
MAETVRKVASSSATVLIRGESGTGKSLLAEVIHRHSARASGPFVEVHCAALSSGVLESELFGHVKGAFTGAHRDKIGRFQMAHGGTLFLDEVGDISLDVQTKLLRVLQERTFEPVGSSESVTVDVRLITATHQPLEELIRKGRLREDLFYRLNVISVYFPPLRERRDDIAELAAHFLRQSAERVGKPVEGIDAEAFDRLMSYSWPGNIRELENVIERAAVLTDGPMISLADLPAELLADQVPLLAPPPRQEWRPDITMEPESPTGALSSELDRIERQRLLDALEARGGNKSKAAAMLGIPRSTFCSKLKKFGIA